MAAGAKFAMRLISVVVSIPVGIATKKVVERTWHAARPADPPRKAKEADVRWGDALGWAVLSAAGIVVAELVTRAGSEAAFRAITGSEPPAPKPSKAAKKLSGASEKSKATAD